jgi:ankyrin repeat protein
MARLFFPLLVVLVVLAVQFTSGEIMEMASDVDSEGFVEEPESPYFDAARTGSLERINREISLGHDVNVRNQDGWSPLMFAVEAGQSYAMYMVSRPWTVLSRSVSRR